MCIAFWGPAGVNLRLDFEEPGKELADLRIVTQAHNGRNIW